VVRVTKPSQLNRSFTETVREGGMSREYGGGGGGASSDGTSMSGRAAGPMMSWAIGGGAPSRAAA
jgi:hypothetical protein